ncbi:hypothetical protein ACPCVO_35105 [Streptomyces umbrinus]|uniref:hypothetical protein n=1 Tax=Streptomyces umbrinus TaxID=67370 RepID=UPI003C2EB28A
MADATALYSLISGIGGALIGGIAGVYGPALIDKRRREHEGMVHKQAASREEKEKALATIADATGALQDWHRLITRTLQDLEAGRQVDVGAFDESADSVMRSVVQAISLVGSRSFRSARRSGDTHSQPDDGDQRRPVTLAMQQVTFDLRRQLLVPQPGFDIHGSFTASASGIRNDLMKVFIAERELLVGSRRAIGADYYDGYL